MTAPVAGSDRELVRTRLIAAPRRNLYRAWTEPELLKQWFTPPPYRTVRAELDLRPGGSNLIVMQGPDGTEFPNRGVYLDIVENERLVFTDAYTAAWEPSEKPFMTVVITFADEAGGNALYRVCTPLARGRSRSARKDGLSPGLGHRHRSTRRTRRHPVTAAALSNAGLDADRR